MILNNDCGWPHPCSLNFNPFSPTVSIPYRWFIHYQAQASIETTDWVVEQPWICAPLLELPAAGANFDNPVPVSPTPNTLHGRWHEAPATMDAGPETLSQLFDPTAPTY